MKTDYSDILDRLGPPLWWDEHGAPRYVPFDPYRAAVYACVVALMEVECQWCGKKFTVAVSMGDIALHNWKKYHPNEDYHPTPKDANAFYYGDPPRHGPFEKCPAGDTMSSIPVRVLEFWEWNRETFEWERKREYEVTFIQEEPVDDCGTFDERLKNEEEITMCSTCQDLYRGVCFYQCGVRATWRPAYNTYLESYSDEGKKAKE